MGKTVKVNLFGVLDIRTTRDWGLFIISGLLWVFLVNNIYQLFDIIDTPIKLLIFVILWFITAYILNKVLGSKRFVKRRSRRLG